MKTEDIIFVEFQIWKRKNIFLNEFLEEKFCFEDK